MTFPRMGNRLMPKPAAGAQFNRAHPLASGMVLALPMNEGSGRMLQNYADPREIGPDTAGQGQGKLINPAWTGGENGFALKFNGSSDKVTMGGGTVDGIQSPTDLTVYTWIIKAQFTTTAGLQNVMNKINAAGTTAQYGLLMNAGTLGWQNSSGADVAYTGVTISANTWYTFAATLDGTTLRIYENGRFNTSAARTATSQVNGPTLGDDDKNGRFFSGFVEYAYLWNRPLAAEDVEWAFQEPYAMFRGPEVARNFAMLGRQ